MHLTEKSVGRTPVDFATIGLPRRVQSVRFVVRKVLRCPLLFALELPLALRVKANYLP